MKIERYKEFNTSTLPLIRLDGIIDYNRWDIEINIILLPLVLLVYMNPIVILKASLCFTPIHPHMFCVWRRWKSMKERLCRLTNIYRNFEGNETREKENSSRETCFTTFTAFDGNLRFYGKISNKMKALIVSFFYSFYFITRYWKSLNCQNFK